MKNKLASAGYIVQTKADYDKTINAAKAEAQKTGSTPGTTAQKVVYRVVVNVTNGMTSIDVGRALQRAKIIPNAFKFSKDIEHKKIENNLRPGTFVVDSGMSYDKIISTIFKKR
jgi:cell division protein YceG involved in septum cleavage